MSARKPPQLPPEPPPAVSAALRKGFTARESQIFDALFVVRSTAQRLDNAVSGWMADTTASPARFQILALLWASENRPVPHRDIVAALGVTRATVSGLMAGLERDGLVTSREASDDRRCVLANLTRKGRATVEKAIEATRDHVRTAFDALSPDELATLTSLLVRVREGFSATEDNATRLRRPA